MILRTEPLRARLWVAHFRSQVTFATFGVATYMLPPPAPPLDCAEAAAGAATIAHAISAQAPRAGTRMSRKLLRPLFGLGPTGLADGLAPEERRYHRVIGGFAPRRTSFDA